MWYRYGDEKPILKKKVLVFRSLREKYIVASLHHFTNEEEGEGFSWVTEHGTCHNCLDDDAWMIFEYYQTSKLYN